MALPGKDFEARLTAALESAQIEMIILAGFLKILSADFTRKWPNRILNVHPALIPSFCGEGFYGLKVHEAALRYGVKVTGATVHYVNEVPDGGEIILQKPWISSPATRRRSCSAASWSRPSGFCSPKPPNSWRRSCKNKHPRPDLP